MVRHGSYSVALSAVLAVGLLATCAGAVDQSGGRGSSSTCGNGAVEVGEECDDGNDNDTDACRNDCLRTVAAAGHCGDGKVDPWEDCDLGAANGGCFCPVNCIKTPVQKCGNGVVDVDECVKEECDDGKYNSNLPSATCTVSCKKPRCGDGIRQGTECCDAGPDNGKNGACSVSCRCAQ